MSSFSFIGHDKIYGDLWALYAQGRLGSSLLFSGSEGIGKKAVALYWIKSMLCRAPRREGGVAHPCGVCAACIQIEARTCADLLAIEEQGPQISIQKIRELKKWALLASLSGKKKFAIIDNAHTLHRAAANALLKLLEEPNPDLVIVLVSSQPSRLLATIRSRSLSYRFCAPVWGPELEALLREKCPDKPMALLKEWFGVLNGAVGLLLGFPIMEWEELRRDLYAALLHYTCHAATKDTLLERLKARKAERWLVFDLIAALLTSASSLAWPREVLWRRVQLFADSRRAYREVLHDELFWEDFFNRWHSVADEAWAPISYS